MVRHRWREVTARIEEWSKEKIYGGFDYLDTLKEKLWESFKTGCANYGEKMLLLSIILLTVGTFYFWWPQANDPAVPDINNPVTTGSDVPSHAKANDPAVPDINNPPTTGTDKSAAKGELEETESNRQEDADRNPHKEPERESEHDGSQATTSMSSTKKVDESKNLPDEKGRFQPKRCRSDSNCDGERICAIWHGEIYQKLNKGEYMGWCEDKGY